MLNVCCPAFKNKRNFLRESFVRNLITVIVFAFLSLTIVSCSTTKNIKYFQDIPDSGQLKVIPKADYSEPVIQVDDIMTILVETVDPQATASINLGNIPVTSAVASGASNTASQQPLSGYLVNKDGYVQMPVLGRIKLVGFTTEQARDTILKEALKYFKDPTVIVRYANFKVSVTGEVQRPGQYLMPNEKVTIMDALAMAGDLTIYGKRENVLLIRENEDGTKTPHRIDLRKTNILTQPYYYLKQNDIIYVEPGKGKAAANDASQARTFAIISSIITIVIVVVSRINF